jgi:hypothetical protein
MGAKSASDAGRRQRGWTAARNYKMMEQCGVSPAKTGTLDQTRASAGLTFFQRPGSGEGRMKKPN